MNEPLYAQTIPVLFKVINVALSKCEIISFSRFLMEIDMKGEKSVVREDVMLASGISGEEEDNDDTFSIRWV